MTSQNRNEGNFANDRERASEAGQKGGQHSHGGTDQKQSDQSGSKTGQQGGGSSRDGDHGKSGQTGR